MRSMLFLRPGVTQAKTIKPREKDPAIIFMDQLCRICRISKRKAVWLPENGISAALTNANAHGTMK